MVSSLLVDDGVPFLAFNVVLPSILGNINSVDIMDLVVAVLEARKALDGAFPTIFGAGRGHQAEHSKINPNATNTPQKICLHVRFA